MSGCQKSGQKKHEEQSDRGCHAKIASISNERCSVKPGMDIRIYRVSNPLTLRKCQKCWFMSSEAVAFQLNETLDVER